VRKYAISAGVKSKMNFIFHGRKERKKRKEDEKMKMKELEKQILTIEVIDELVTLVILEHNELFTRAILNVMERHPDIVEKYRDAEIQDKTDH